jgi:hypothetical protein
LVFIEHTQQWDKHYNGYALIQPQQQSKDKNANQQERPVAVKITETM